LDESAAPEEFTVFYLHQSISLKREKRKGHKCSLFAIKIPLLCGNSDICGYGVQNGEIQVLS